MRWRTHGSTCTRGSTEKEEKEEKEETAVVVTTAHNSDKAEAKAEATVLPGTMLPLPPRNGARTTSSKVGSRSINATATDEEEEEEEEEEEDEEEEEEEEEEPPLLPPAASF
jgi:vacuolar-type H+-ATPase subunit I/STV1